MILTGQSRVLRIGTFTALYFSQGIPIGLLSIAMPAWMAQSGFADAQVAGFLAVLGLPWAFKLIAGPFMDRFTYPSMGRRRPWVMGAQVGLMLTLVSLSAIQNPTTQLFLLTSIGFLVNCFAAGQDVAVDGMAIDVTPMDERGRLNSFMAFGQVLGYSAFGGLCGLLLSKFGLTVTALVCALVVGAILAWVTLTKERAADRYLPGRRLPSATQTPAVVVAPNSLKAVFAQLAKVMSLPMSLNFIALGLLSNAALGLIVVVLPLLAVKELGYGAALYAQTYGALSIGAAVFGLGLGPVIDRFGAKIVFQLGNVLGVLVLVTFALNTGWWSSTAVVLVALSCALLSSQMNFIGFIALGMNICWKPVAATQFAMFMALANLGRALGSGTYAGFAESISYGQALLLAAAALGLTGICLYFFHEHKQRTAIQTLDSERDSERDPAVA